MNRPACGARGRTHFLAAALCVAQLLAGPAAARVGMGDPAADEHNREADAAWVLHGDVRLRAMGGSDLDLNRGLSPSTGLPLWPAGATPLDLSGGADARVRLSPRFFLGDDLKIVVDADLLNNLAVGLRPAGRPYTGVDDTLTLADPWRAAQRAVLLRSAYVAWLSPFGLLQVGRMASHFGIGIAANAGDALDDDGGERADRVAWVAPLFGHYLAAAYDFSVLSFGSVNDDPRTALTLGEQALSFAFLRFHSPWELDIRRAAGRTVVDYGAAVSFEWQSKDVPGLAPRVAAAFGQPVALVRRDARVVVADGWLRLVSGAWRVEAEVVVSDLAVENPSVLPGITLRAPLLGNPFLASLIVENRVIERLLTLRGEAGMASADPAPGFPLAQARPFAGSQPGDVFGPQVDFKRAGDTRLDAGRIHPTHRIDLILWRTLLGGVSEAAYGRLTAEGTPTSTLRLEASGVYSHALSAASTPGGVAPLGVEGDVAAELCINPLQPVDPDARVHACELAGVHARVDAGVLFPLGGLGVRGGDRPQPAGLLLARVAYVF